VGFQLLDCELSVCVLLNLVIPILFWEDLGLSGEIIEALPHKFYGCYAHVFLVFSAENGERLNEVDENILNEFQIVAHNPAYCLEGDP